MPTLRLPLSEWNRRRETHECRLDTLQRLYARKDAVDDLIRALEHYQELTPVGQGECIPIVATLKCS
jgi:hypothetical protein